MRSAISIHVCGRIRVERLHIHLKAERSKPPRRAGTFGTFTINQTGTYNPTNVILETIRNPAMNLSHENSKDITRRSGRAETPSLTFPAITSGTTLLERK